MTSSYSKTSVFVLQCKREASVLKNLHSGERFWENEFSVIVFTGYVRMVGETRDKKPPFSNKNGYMWTGHKTLSTRIRIFLKTDIFSPLSKNTLPHVAYLNNFRTSTRKRLNNEISAIWYGMNSNGRGLEQVVHTHWKSCRSGWPRGFGSLNTVSYSWIFTSLSVVSRLALYSLLRRSE